MISSTRSRLLPPPKPSALSARPSSWKAPVKSSVASSDKSRAGKVGSQ